jgi:hypothetical protein
MPMPSMGDLPDEQDKTTNEGRWLRPPPPFDQASRAIVGLDRTTNLTRRNEMLNVTVIRQTGLTACWQCDGPDAFKSIGEYVDRQLALLESTRDEGQRPRIATIADPHGSCIVLYYIEENGALNEKREWQW